MSSVSMEDLSKIEEEFLQADEEAKLDPKTDKLQISEKSEEKPQLEDTSGAASVSNDALPDKKNDEKSTVVERIPPAVSPPPLVPNVKVEKADDLDPSNDSSNNGASKSTDSTMEVDPNPSVAVLPAVNVGEDAEMEPVILGTYTAKDLTIKDPTETEANTKDLFNGTIQLLMQILGSCFNF